jgi:hypothetical protein
MRDLTSTASPLPDVAHITADRTAIPEEVILEAEVVALDSEGSAGFPRGLLDGSGNGFDAL